VADAPEPGKPPRRELAIPLPVAAVMPLVLLALLLYAFFKYEEETLGPLGKPPAPIEKLAIERVVFSTPDDIALTVRNVGPEPVTVAQLLVNEAIWDHSIQPRRELGRLDGAEIHVAYPWEAGQPVKFTIVSGNGLRFEKDIPVAAETPKPDARYLGTFALLGAYVGVIPVFLGILWFPFLKRIGDRWLSALLAFTAGLLLFLAIDAVEEALEVAERLPDVYNGKGLVAIGTIGTLLGLLAIGRRGGGARAASPLGLAYLIAIGIGLHNLGEGLAIGAAYVLGEVALGTFLVVGFTLHNTTEGLAIVAPVLRSGARLLHLAGLGLVAGAPTIAGAWIGAFTYSDVFSTLFLAVGAGAVLQVVHAIAAHMGRDGQDLLARRNVAAFVIGLLVMYGTGLLVAL